MSGRDKSYWLPGDILDEEESDWLDPDDANDFSELEDYWIDMPDEEGIDIFEAKYGPPTGSEA